MSDGLCLLVPVKISDAVAALASCDVCINGDVVQRAAFIAEREEGGWIVCRGKLLAGPRMNDGRWTPGETTEAR